MSLTSDLAELKNHSEDTWITKGWLHVAGARALLHAQAVIRWHRSLSWCGRLVNRLLRVKPVPNSFVQKESGDAPDRPILDLSRARRVLRESADQSAPKKDQPWR